MGTMHRVNTEPKSRRPRLPTIPVIRCKPALICMALCLLVSIVTGMQDYIDPCRYDDQGVCGTPCTAKDNCPALPPKTCDLCQGTRRIDGAGADGAACPACLNAPPTRKNAPRYQVIDIAVNVPTKHICDRCGHERPTGKTNRYCSQGICGTGRMRGLYVEQEGKTHVLYHCCKPVTVDCITKIKKSVEPKPVVVKQVSFYDT